MTVFTVVGYNMGYNKGQSNRDKQYSEAIEILKMYPVITNLPSATSTINEGTPYYPTEEKIKSLCDDSSVKWNTGEKQGTKSVGYYASAKDFSDNKLTTYYCK